MGDSTTISTGTGTPHAEVQDFTFVIQTPLTITVNPATLPDSTVGAAYSQALSASFGTAPFTFAVTPGSLPSGLNLAADGPLTGTPAAGGSFAFTAPSTNPQSTRLNTRKSCAAGMPRSA